MAPWLFAKQKIAMGYSIEKPWTNRQTYQGYFTRPLLYGPNCVISKHLKFITFQPDKVCY